MKQETNSGAEAPERIVFEKDKAGQRIYDVKTVKLPEQLTVMDLDRLVALAVDFQTPHFRLGRTHYVYLPHSGVAVALEDVAAVKPATCFLGIYGKRIMPGCGHEWGEPVGPDGTLSDGTIEIYDAEGKRAAVIV